MNTFWSRFGPADLLAAILIIGILIRDGTDLDKIYPIVVVSIVAFYFGHVSGTRQKVDIQADVKPSALQ